MAGTEAVSLTQDQTTAILAAVLANLRVVKTSPALTSPGSPSTASIVPLSPQIDVSDLAAGVINVGAAIKDVIFRDASALPIPDQGDVSGTDILQDLEAGVNPVLGGQPFPPPVGAVGGRGVPVATDVAGLLGQIFGTIAIPQLRINATVRWIVRRADGTEEAEGTDFVTTNGTAIPTISVLLPPLFQELRLDTLMLPQIDGRCLTAEVTLGLGPWQVTAELPPIPIYLLPLLIPTCIALFEEPNFGATYGGAALIIVPFHSPVTSLDALLNALNKVYSALDGLNSLASVATWLLGISSLLDALPKQPRVRLIQRDGIDDLDEIGLRSHPPLPDFASDSYSDATRSLILLGLTGTTAQFYNDEGYNTGDNDGAGVQGWYSLTVPEAAVRAAAGSSVSGGLWAIIPDLGGVDAHKDLPRTLPPGCARFGHTDDYFSDVSPDNTWSASMSSVRFEKSWLDSVTQAINAVTKQPDGSLPDLGLPALQPPSLPTLGCVDNPLSTGSLAPVPVPVIPPPPPTKIY